VLKYEEKNKEEARETSGRGKKKLETKYRSSVEGGRSHSLKVYLGQQVLLLGLLRPQKNCSKVVSGITIEDQLSHRRLIDAMGRHERCIDS